MRPWESCYTVNPETGCFEWQMSRKEKGYGQAGGGRRAHRIAWERAYGPIPEGMQVLHRCDNPPCVNPEHLFLGTNADNRADSVMKDRPARGERVRSARLTAEDVLAIRHLYWLTRSSLGRPSQQEIADVFGVARTTVQAVVEGRTWRHLCP